MDKKYRCYSFSINLPVGEGQDNVPNLLRHVAKAVEEFKEPIEIQDIVFHLFEFDGEDNELPSATVYYGPKE